MGKKIFYSIVFILWFLFLCISLYSYRKYRQCYIQSREYQDYATRITEENTRLKNAMYDIRESVDGIREAAGELESLNGSTISGLDECIRELKEIREQVYIMEKYCDSVNYNIGCSISD